MDVGNTEKSKVVIEIERKYVQRWHPDGGGGGDSLENCTIRSTCAEFLVGI